MSYELGCLVSFVRYVSMLIDFFELHETIRYPIHEKFFFLHNLLLVENKLEIRFEY